MPSGAGPQGFIALMLVYLGLGSNTGDRALNIKKALEAMRDDPRFSLMRVSRFYLTSPVGPEQRYFINAAALVKTRLEPLELLCAVKDLEKMLGRKAALIRLGPRKIDIDVLFYGKRVIEERGLKIPHAEIANRLFVLTPLCDIAPDFRHPRLRKTVRKLRDALLLTCVGQRVKILKSRWRMRTESRSKIKG